MDNLRLDVERLEDRRMLAASINFNAGSGLLRISGNAESDDVQLDGLGTTGAIRAFENGAPVGQYSGVKRIRALLGGGNDELEINAIIIDGSLNVRMGAGRDELRIDNSVVDQVPGVNGDLQISGAVSVNMGNNHDDFVEFTTTGIDNSHSFGGNVRIVAAADVLLDGHGTSFFEESEDINISGNLFIRINDEGDANGDISNLRLSNVNVTGSTSLRSSREFDNVSVRDSTIAGRFAVNLGAGLDYLDLGPSVDASRFFRSATLRGGAGNDELFQGASLFAVDPRIISFERLL